jgi:hypothetical protein
MIKADITYSFINEELFKSRTLPYIFGCGMFYLKMNPELRIKEQEKRYFVTFTLETKSLTQFVVATTGMLRFSPDCILEKIDVIKTPAIQPKQITLNDENKHIVGAILKPALFFQDSIKGIIDYANKNNFDFIKDDDASEYSAEEFSQIKFQIKGPKYLQKITKLEDAQGDWLMIVPWVYGWQLLVDASKLKPTASHCASLPLQISWPVFVTFSRLAGASFVIGADTKFDDTWILESIFDAATIKIDGIPEIKVILGGGVNPERVNSVLKSTKAEWHKNLGFAMGSWIANEIEKRN